MTSKQTLQIKHLQVQHLSARYLSLQVGEVVSLSGASGSGKSLFLRALADLVVNEGDVVLDGCSRDTMVAPQWRSRIIFVAADPVWWADQVRDHFKDPKVMAGYLADLKLDRDAMDWPVSRLSSGEEQRLCLLRALEGVDKEQPCFLLLDEPTSALDDDATVAVEALVARFVQDYPLGVLLVSHDRAQVKRWGQRHWEITADHRLEEIT